MDLASFIWISTFGVLIVASVVWCGIFVYRFIRAYWNTPGK